MPKWSSLWDITTTTGIAGTATTTVIAANR
jgi:hypothetical protein